MMSSKTYITWLLAVAALFGVQRAMAQETPAAASTLLEKVQKAYHDGYLGFQVKYLYANDNEPNKYLDSLSGRVDLQGKRSRFLIDGTETLVTEKYSIQVRDDDKMIYIGASGQQPQMLDVTGVLDSALLQKGKLQIGLEQQGRQDLLTIHFPPDQLYISIRMIVDRKTGFLDQILYTLHTQPLVGLDQMSSDEHKEGYQPVGRVLMLFSKYTRHVPDNQVFDENRIFSRSGHHFEPAQAYKAYKIFLASTNL